MGREEDDVVLEEEGVSRGGGGGKRGEELGEVVAVAILSLLGLHGLAFAGRNVDYSIPTTTTTSSSP